MAADAGSTVARAAASATSSAEQPSARSRKGVKKKLTSSEYCTFLLSFEESLPAFLDLAKVDVFKATHRRAPTSADKAQNPTGAGRSSAKLRRAVWAKMLESDHEFKAKSLDVEFLDRRFRDVCASAIKKHKEFCNDDSTSTARQAARARHVALPTKLEGLDRVVAVYASAFGMVRTKLADNSLRVASGPCYPSHRTPAECALTGDAAARPGNPFVRQRTDTRETLRLETARVTTSSRQLTCHTSLRRTSSMIQS